MIRITLKEHKTAMKRVLIIALVLLMISTLVGCALFGAPGSAGDSSKPEEVTSSPAAQDNSTDTPSSSGGVTESHDPEDYDYLDDLESSPQQTSTAPGAASTASSGGRNDVGTSSNAAPAKLDNSSKPTGTSSTVPSGGNSSGGSSGASDTSSSTDIELPIVFF